MSECSARNGGFLASPRQHSRRTQPALQDTNGPQKPGRTIAPTGPRSPIASAASDLDLPLQRGLSLARDVFGRRSTPIYADMDTTAHNTRTRHFTRCPGYPGARVAATGNRNSRISRRDARQQQCPACPGCQNGQPGRQFPAQNGSTSRTGGVSRLSRLETILSYTRARWCAHTRLTHSINCSDRQDSRDTPGGAPGVLPSTRLSGRIGCPGWINPQTGHPGRGSRSTEATA
jgi:hypothetical protein